GASDVARTGIAANAARARRRTLARDGARAARPALDGIVDAARVAGATNVARTGIALDALRACAARARDAARASTARDALIDARAARAIDGAGARILAIDALEALVRSTPHVARDARRTHDARI